MSVWRNGGFTENELSGPAKVIVGPCVVAGLLVAQAEGRRFESGFPLQTKGRQPLRIRPRVAGLLRWCGRWPWQGRGTLARELAPSPNVCMAFSAER
jgi:hypothetical protein